MARVTTCADYHNRRRAARSFRRLAYNLADVHSKRPGSARLSAGRSFDDGEQRIAVLRGATDLAVVSPVGGRVIEFAVLEVLDHVRFLFG